MKTSADLAKTRTNQKTTAARFSDDELLKEYEALKAVRRRLQIARCGRVASDFAERGHFPIAITSG